MFSLVVRLALLFGVGWLLCTQVFLFTQVHGQDMFPAMKDGDLVIAFRLQQKYSKGDVVVCEVNGKRIVSRIAANRGDVVDLKDTGSLVVNGTVQGGEIIYPTYAREPLTYPYRVPEDSAFLLGDHRTESTDSRDFGAVPYSQVQGKVITILRRREL
ncbi:MAG: signal peptidase I [Oscillospiraceae bacterium]|nr:signal peptidase I [Oscillospiraceae bacterium]